MRRKLSVRVGAIIMSATMLVNSITPVMAANNGAAVKGTVETTMMEDLVEEAVSQNAVDETGPENLVEETLSNNTVDETVSSNSSTDETLEQAGAYDGTPSKVIGVEWKDNYSTYNMGSEGIQQYVVKNPSKSVTYPGTKEQSESLKVFEDGVYLYEGVYYRNRYVYMIE